LGCPICSDIPGFKEQLKRRQKCLLHEFRANVLGVVISHPKPLFAGEVEYDWLKKDTWEKNPAMTRLLSDDSQEADVDGVFALIYFLSQTAKQVWFQE
jgi:hypothetical protein